MLPQQVASNGNRPCPGLAAIARRVWIAHKRRRRSFDNPKWRFYLLELRAGGRAVCIYSLTHCRSPSHHFRQVFASPTEPTKRPVWRVVGSYAPLAYVAAVFNVSTWFMQPVLLNGPSWFVSTLWFYYWCFPSLLPRLQAYTTEQMRKWIYWHYLAQMLIGASLFGIFCWFWPVRPDTSRNALWESLAKERLSYGLRAPGLGSPRAVHLPAASITRTHQASDALCVGAGGGGIGGALAGRVHVCHVLATVPLPRVHHGSIGGAAEGERP